jgi:hypothetical protein
VSPKIKNREKIAEKSTMTTLMTMEELFLMMKDMSSC